jgi:hypothetical protein
MSKTKPKLQMKNPPKRVDHVVININYIDTATAPEVAAVAFCTAVGAAGVGAGAGAGFDALLPPPPPPHAANPKMVAITSTR